MTWHVLGDVDGAYCPTHLTTKLSPHRQTDHEPDDVEASRNIRGICIWNFVKKGWTGCTLILEISPIHIQVAYLEGEVSPQVWKIHT